MAAIFIDGQKYEVAEGQNLLAACLSLGFDIPFFCWHPALHSVGACRQCAVKQFRDENDTRGKIVMSCMTPASDGVRISIDDPEVLEFRRSVIEWLMLNHPHDCPVCDEGGECHLQDMTVLVGHNYRRSRSKKRTYKNQYLGPFLNHEMNRCIQCYRCVRFYREYAGGKDLQVFGAHHHVYFGRFQDGVLQNPFSGNLVEVCPTGVFTDATLKKHYTRKWDLQTAPSVCVHCGLGCNTIAGERYGLLRRIYNRYNHQVNGYFICDRGRFGYEFVNSRRRIKSPVIREQGERISSAGEENAVSEETVLKRVSDFLSRGGNVVGIGSPRASLESNFALMTLVGRDNFYSGMSPAEHPLMETVLEILAAEGEEAASIADAEKADAVFILGEDIVNSAPRLELSLRQAVLNRPMSIAQGLKIPLWDAHSVRNAIQDERGPLFIATPAATSLDELARGTFRGSPRDIARLGFAVAHAIDPKSPEVPDLGKEQGGFAEVVARELLDARLALVVAGTGCGSVDLLHAAANTVTALRKKGGRARICLAVPECNSVGVMLLGGKNMAEILPAPGKGAEDAVMVDATVFILENDLFRRSGSEAVYAFLKRYRHVVAIDFLASRTTEAAEVVLPAAPFSEGSGTLVNNEGRAQRFYRVFVPDGEVMESWKWISEISQAAGRTSGSGWQNLDQITGSMAEEFPVLEPVIRVLPGAAYRHAGMKVPRQSHRYSGRTAMHANVTIHEPPPPEDPDSPLTFSMEGTEQDVPSSLVPLFWRPHWNSVQSLIKFQEEVNGPLRGGVPGARLFTGEEKKQRRYQGSVPKASTPGKGSFIAAAAPHVFGSEELSAFAPAIDERAPHPYLGMADEDAKLFGIGEGGQVRIEAAGSSRRLPVRLVPGLAPGCVVLPVGLPGVDYMELPAVVKLHVADEEGHDG
jgi:NADH-quinone oxidoreductase subunit G